MIDRSKKPDGKNLDETNPDAASTQPSGRRLFIFRAAAVLTGVVAAAVAQPMKPARAQSDSDPTDAPGRGRGGSTNGNTDSDPTDVVGSGKMTKQNPTSTQTDNDPNDPPGRGKS